VQVRVFDLLSTVHRPGSSDAKSLLSLGSGCTLWSFVSPEPGRGRAAASSCSIPLTSLTAVTPRRTSLLPTIA
jgi:hypothetical protein